MTIYPSTGGTISWANDASTWASNANTWASNDRCIYYPNKTPIYANEYLNYPITYTPIINNNYEESLYFKKDYITNDNKVWGNIYTKYGPCETPTTCTYDYGKYAVFSTPIPPVPPAQRLRAILASRSGPLLIGTRRALVPTSQEREMRARETLCRVIGEEKFRKFLRCGFVTVKAPSGLVYQIFPGHEMTRVWDKGKQIEKLCVVLRGDFPPTDTLIVRYLMILNNEQQFRALANKSIPYSTQSKPQAVDMRSLVDIWKELKVAA